MAPHAPSSTVHPRRPAGRLCELVSAVSMTVGRARAARLVADLAELRPGDHVVDVGCGPGAAVREASRRGARATGVDPSAMMLRMARWATRLRPGGQGSEFVKGAAESLPLADEAAEVLWALSSVHHWSDRPRGLAEARRVLAPGGRMVLAERLLKPHAKGHAHHGQTAEGAEELSAAVAGAGFVDVERQVRRAGFRTLVVFTAITPGTRPRKIDQGEPL